MSLIGCNWFRSFCSASGFRLVQYDLGLLWGTCMTSTVKFTSRSGGCVRTWGLFLALPQRERERLCDLAARQPLKKKKQPSRLGLVRAMCVCVFYTTLRKLNCINSKTLRCVHGEKRGVLVLLIWTKYHLLILLFD